MRIHTCEETIHTHEIDLKNSDGPARCEDASLSSQDWEDGNRKVPGACWEASMVYLGSYGSVKEILSKINNVGGP